MTLSLLRHGLLAMVIKMDLQLIELTRLKIILQKTVAGFLLRKMSTIILTSKNTDKATQKMMPIKSGRPAELE